MCEFENGSFCHFQIPTFSNFQILYNLMFLIRNNILQSPFHPCLHGLLAYGAIVFGADGAAEGQAAVGMNKQFDGIAEIIFDEFRQFINFEVRLVDIEVPGNGKMAIHMQQSGPYLITRRL
jgi:hypothetical protein